MSCFNGNAIKYGSGKKSSMALQHMADKWRVQQPLGWKSWDPPLFSCPSFPMVLFLSWWSSMMDSTPASKLETQVDLSQATASHASSWHKRPLNWRKLVYTHQVFLSALPKTFPGVIPSTLRPHGRSWLLGWMPCISWTSSVKLPPLLRKGRQDGWPKNIWTFWPYSWMSGVVWIDGPRWPPCAWVWEAT